MTKISNQNVELMKENEDIETKVNQTMSKVNDFENGFFKEFSMLEAEINDLKKVFTAKAPMAQAKWDTLGP